MERDVIIACDFKSKEELFEFLKPFKGMNPYLKIGMEMFYKEGPELVLGVDITNVHAEGGIAMMKAAREGLDATELGKKTKLIAVTILTSINDEVLHNELHVDNNYKVADTVRAYALNAKEAGLDGVVCSALEAPIIKEIGFMSVTPGIRLQGDSVNDQKRVATPAYAKELGSSYIVVGRSITKAADPVSAYNQCKKEFE